MADHRKTLQHGSPDDDSDPGPRALSYPAAVPQQPHHGYPPAPAVSQAPSMGSPVSSSGPALPYPAYGQPRQSHSGQQPPPSSQGELPHGYALRSPSQIPPPPTQDALPRRAPPPGTRTPSEHVQAPAFVRDLPDGAPGWMLRARRLSLALEEAIAAGRPSASTEACIERAWAGWQLDGSTDKQIARVAQLVETAYMAMRGSTDARLGQTVKDVADVIWAGLPRSAKARCSFDLIVSVVRGLRQEPDPWSAAVGATSKILGWTDGARAQAAHAIRVALMASRTG